MTTEFDQYKFAPLPFLFPGKPAGFDNPSKYCLDRCWLGTLKTQDEQPLNWMLRNRYYPKIGQSHIARTPFYAVRYAILTYTKKGDTVLDPFMGSGTTGVEALLFGRNTIGVELEFPQIARETLASFNSLGKWKLLQGDSELQLDKIQDRSVQLVNFSNPYPDGADHSMVFGRRSLTDEEGRSIRKSAPEDQKYRRYSFEGNSGLLKGEAYWEKMKGIQAKACKKLKRGGHAVFVIKDLVKNKQVFPLHEKLADLLPPWMEHVGTFALPHYPPTQFMNSYQKIHGIRPPMEQVCPVFKRVR